LQKGHIKITTWKNFKTYFKVIELKVFETDQKNSLKLFFSTFSFVKIVSNEVQKVFEQSLIFFVMKTDKMTRRTKNFYKVSQFSP